MGMSNSALTGRLVVATPSLADGNFAATVVLILEHELDAGAVGVVLNRPSDVAVSDALPAWAPLAAVPGLVFVGGPVQREAVIAVARDAGGAPSVQQVLPGLAVVDLDREPGSVDGEVTDLRLFAGYAGWSAGQLEAEIMAGGWFVVDAEPDDVVTVDPADLWVHVLARQGGLFTTACEDPGRN